ncbi:MAG: BMP family ABC transporter substrate-binding protein [Candidatus Riflebacteria bacterium]|nr:BMP family ABC transporter substrate-binding protein [Candidatus Riflebacteria bacterium]
MATERAIPKPSMGIRFLTLILALVGMMLASGCGEENNKPAVVKKPRIGLMITPKGLNDRGFNDMAFEGLKSAERKSGVETVIIEPATMKDPETSLRFFAGQNFDAIIAVGGAFLKDIRTISKEQPELPFFVIDSSMSEGNIRGVSFREHEGSYLCGYTAASVSKTGKIGFIGGVKIDVIQRFAAGYRQGALAAASQTQIIEYYLAEDFSGFNRPDLAKNAALELYKSGCDVIYHAAGASGLGVISAAVETKKFVIGVDSNQDSLAPGQVLTSMLKRVDLVVEDVARTLSDRRGPESVKLSYGMADGAIDLTDFQFSRRVVDDELMARLTSLKQDIIAGRLIVSPTFATSASTTILQTSP